MLNGKKTPSIPPVFHVKFIVAFKEKGEVFNTFLAKQCSLLDNGSTLPFQCLMLTSKMNLGIRKIFSKLDSNKAHGQDMISIRMLKICDKSIFKPLEVIFKSCLVQAIFPSEWKEASAVPILKKRQEMNQNYRS